MSEHKISLTVLGEAVMTASGTQDGHRKWSPEPGTPGTDPPPPPWGPISTELEIRSFNLSKLSLALLLDDSIISTLKKLLLNL